MWLLLPFIMGFVGWAVEVAARINSHHRALEAFAENQRRWDSSYFCHRCGDVFELSSPPN
jgi:hypothetical protein